MKFDDIKKLHQKKFREELGHFLIEGEHLVQELEKAAVRDARLRASEVYVTHEYAGLQGKLPTQVINARQMAQISETRSPQGIAAVVPLLSAAPAAPGERAIYLHEIQDP
jgi:RNA methyltransferase, TrmH family